MFFMPKVITNHLMDTMKVVEKLQISAFYFPTFEKADCTIFALLVGRSVGWLVGVLWTAFAILAMFFPRLLVSQRGGV